MKSSLVSCKLWAPWLSYMSSAFLPRNSDRNSPVTVLLRVDWVSQWLWDHPIGTDHQPSTKEWAMCPIYHHCDWMYVRKTSFYPPLPPLSSSPLPLTLTVTDLFLNGQLNALILAKMAWRRITYQRLLGYLSVNGGSLAFGGIWGPRSQDNCRSSVC